MANSYTSQADNDEPRTACTAEVDCSPLPAVSAIAQPDPYVGKELAGRYVVTELLGTGAMGTVYAARHKLLNRQVAVKILKPDVAHDEVSRQRFATEARAASSLTHPNLIAVHDVGFAPDATPFLVMDYLEGESLAAALKTPGKVDPARLLNILKQVCAGLHHAHSKGLVHRDLKPNNIMLLNYAGGRDLVKIVDFGIVKAAGADQNLTQAGQIFGTPYYMSPEQCQGRKLDGRSDIYSLGCVIYRILAGRPPFCGETPMATLIMHVKDAPPLVADQHLTSEALRNLVPVMWKMLAKDPADRYQSAEQLRSDLEQIETSTAPTVPELGEGLCVPQSLVLKPQRRILIATIIGCVLTAMAVVALVGASLFKEAPPEAVPTPTAAESLPDTAPAPMASDQPQFKHIFSGSPPEQAPATQSAPTSVAPEASDERPQKRTHQTRKSEAAHKRGGIRGFFHRLFK